MQLYLHPVTFLTAHIYFSLRFRTVSWQIYFLINTCFKITESRYPMRFTRVSFFAVRTNSMCFTRVSYVFILQTYISILSWNFVPFFTTAFSVLNLLLAILFLFIAYIAKMQKWTFQAFYRCVNFLKTLLWKDRNPFHAFLTSIFFTKNREYLVG